MITKIFKPKGDQVFSSTRVISNATDAEYDYFPFGLAMPERLYNCSSYKNQLFKGEGGIEQARMNVIIDFMNTYKTPRNYLKEREGKPFDVFILDKRKQSNGFICIYCFT